MYFKFIISNQSQF